MANRKFKRRSKTLRPSRRAARAMKRVDVNGVYVVTKVGDAETPFECRRDASAVEPSAVDGQPVEVGDRYLLDLNEPQEDFGPSPMRSARRPWAWAEYIRKRLGGPR
jgi:hypothetical protein